MAKGGPTILTKIPNQYRHGMAPTAAKLQRYREQLEVDAFDLVLPPMSLFEHSKRHGSSAF